ncbi:MAG TPA: LysM peptidoglycan-binding domain-containing protein [Candidatus Deferrimicrobiaceae bacterium]|jgi:cell wall-associated NlpC family hydrolase
MRKQSHIILLLVALIALGTGVASAATYKVRKGDSLARIAKRQHVSVGALRETNGLEGDALKPGMKLTLPSKGKAAKVAKVDKVDKVEKAEAPEPVPAPAAAAVPVRSAQVSASTTEWAGYHTVAKGDTLATIAHANDLSLEALKKLNPGKNARRLKIGMRLRVKPASETAAAASPALARAAVEAPVAHASGKTPEKMAAKPPVQTAVAEKHPAEPVAAPVVACDVAAAPVYHKVRKGDTLASVASKYGLSLKSLKQLNHVKKAKKLKPGSQLLVRRGGGGGRGRGGSITADRRRELEKILQNEASMTAAGAAAASAKVAELAPELLSAASVDNGMLGPIIEEDQPVGLTGRVIKIAKLMLDLPYRFGGTSLTGIDCSGYVQKVFGFLNIPLPRSAREQFAKGEKIEKEELATGDLVFFKTYARFPSHVGIYLGDNKFIHASSGDHKVKIDSLDAPYFLRRYIGARRLVPDQKDDGE